MGTALMSAVITATGNVNYGVIPILGVFLVGAALLAMVKDDSRNAGIVDGE
jgi:MFS-type transporter involved in bile tolerance (Atg22 family)